MSAVKFPRVQKRPTGLIEKHLSEPNLLVEAEENRRLALLCAEYGVEAGLDSSYRQLALAMARVHHPEPAKRGRSQTWKPDQLLLLCWEVKEITKTGTGKKDACQVLAKDPLWKGFAQSVSTTFGSDTAEALRCRYHSGMRRKNIAEDLRCVNGYMTETNRLFPGSWPEVFNQVKRRLLPRNSRSGVKK